MSRIINHNIMRGVGPGLLYAAAAVGVSHLVQSTRAGAEYGYYLIGFILLVTFLKFPFFRFGPQYAAATGNHLIHGYNRLGSAAVWVLAVITIGTAFIVQGAVTLVTAGLAAELTGLHIPAGILGVLLLLISGVLLVSGKYRLLDRVIRYIIVLLAVATVAAVVIALMSGPRAELVDQSAFDFGNKRDLFFLVALIGWMPAPFDISVWHSIWTVKKNKGLPEKDRDRTGAVDFYIGYAGTVLLAVCFLILGARVLYGSGTELPAGAAQFAGELISMYTQTLGMWTYPVIAVAAFAAMLSTTVTVLDGFTSVSDELSRVIFKRFPFQGIKRYRFWLAVLILGASVLLLFLKGSMRDLVDLVTTVSFVTAPVLGYLNLRVMRLLEVEKQYRPGRFVRYTAYTGLVFLIVFTLYFLYVRFSGM